MEVTKIFKWDCAHRLRYHQGLCRNIHGHTYKMEVSVEGKVNDAGMIIDFGDLKKLVNEVIINKVDHSLILWVKDPLYKSLKRMDKRRKQPFNFRIYPLLGEPTAENMAKHFFRTLYTEIERRRIPIILTKIKVWETPTSYAQYDITDYTTDFSFMVTETEHWRYVYESE